MFFELHEQRNTIFAASEVLGGELQMFFELQEHRNTIFCGLGSARWRATKVL
jgi:hypothetical protein